jgi:outer membrane protein, heavy metal efflux system
MSVKPYLIIILIISGCSYIPFNKKNIETKEITELIKKSDIYNEDFSQFLITQGFNDDELPIKNWGLKELIYAQQFFNPELKTAKMKWEMVKTNEVIANLRPASSIGLEIGRETTNKELSKKIFGGNFSFTIESANKRLIRYELALNKSQLALIDYQITNWKLRLNLFNKLLDFIENQEFIRLSKDELRLKQSIMNMMKKRLEAGIVSQIDLDMKTIEFNKKNQELLELQMEQALIRNQVASLIGLSIQKFNLITLNAKNITSLLDDITVSYLKDKKLIELQEISLTKRLDLRKALSNYAVAEAELKLEVANQYPDYNFTPAYIYEFGTRIWSLGIDSIINSASRNKAFITKAKKFRDLEASKVITLQLSTINDIEELQLNFSNKSEDLKYSKQMLETKDKLKKQLNARFEKGLIDRMEYEIEKINLIDIDKKYHKAIYNLIRIGLLAESILQEPIFTPKIKLLDEK